MASCPNCGRSTVRTQDWACQWCGYPLVSGSFKQISMTYQEAKAERLGSWMTAETAVELESPAAEVEPVAEPEPELVEETEMEVATEVEPMEEVSEEEEEVGEMVAEAEATGEEEEEREAVAEAEVIEEEEEAPEPVVEATEEVEEAREAVTEVETAEEMEEASELVAEAAEEVEKAPEPEIVQITIEELNRICREDSEAAEVRFANTILQVIGVVARIPPMESIENPCLILTNSEKSVARNLLCVFDKQHEAAINQLSVGQMVTVQGKYDGCVINILLNDCVLVD
ncbi:MAG TPA: hypothetical protein G4O10_00345 [Dehalococcoidia bacterium]|nr:hypothetical protein [Dehalococcoidia bacterium]